MLLGIKIAGFNSALMELPKKFYDRQVLIDPIENRTVFCLPEAELSIYETHASARGVEFQFSSPMLASMISGKKVMHLQHQAFDFVPGESLMLAPGEKMRIDFPEASMESPTQCLKLAFSDNLINQTLLRMNETAPRLEEHGEWASSASSYHFANDMAINQIVERMLWLVTEDHPSKALFASFMLQELVIRLLQTEARTQLLGNAVALQHKSRLAAVIQFIRDNLNDPLSIDQLSKHAHMSQAHFFRTFRTELGVSPVDFINAERIKLAKSLLRIPNKSIYDICFDCGFNNVSYFNKVFKRATQLTPSEYRLQAQMR